MSGCHNSPIDQNHRYFPGRDSSDRTGRVPPAAVERGSDRQEAPRSLTDAVAAVPVLQTDSPIPEFRHLAELGSRPIPKNLYYTLSMISALAPPPPLHIAAQPYLPPLW